MPRLTMKVTGGGRMVRIDREIDHAPTAEELSALADAAVEAANAMRSRRLGVDARASGAKRTMVSRGADAPSDPD